MKKNRVSDICGTPSRIATPCIMEFPKGNDKEVEKILEDIIANSCQVCKRMRIQTFKEAQQMPRSLMSTIMSTIMTCITRCIIIKLSNAKYKGNLENSKRGAACLAK